MQLFRRLWESEAPFSFDGRFYRTRDAMLALRPVGACPKIYAASFNPAGQEMIAEFGDTWFTLPMETSAHLHFDALIEKLAGQAAEVKARAARHGRPLGIGVTGHVIACETDEEARTKAQDLLEYGQLNPMNRVAAVQIGSGLVDSYQTVAERMDAYHDAGFDTAMLHFYPMIDRMRTFMNKVVPLIQHSVELAA